MLYIVGLGPGSKELLPLKVYNLLKEQKNIYFRTEKHPVVEELKREGVNYKTFDYLYEREDNFEKVYDEIASALVDQCNTDTIVYGVPGNPMVAEKSVEKLIAIARDKGLGVEVIPAMSFLEPLYCLLNIDPAGGVLILDALSMPAQMPVTWAGCIITQIYNRMVASEVKLNLMELYPDEHEIIVIKSVGVPQQEKIEKLPLYELDRLPWIDYLTSVYLPPLTIESSHCGFPLDPLTDIMERLRGENGCPWDKEQDHETLKRYLIEETYEVLEAIDSKNMHKVCEELGDLLLQIAFHAQIAREKGFFDMNDVVSEISEKLIRRHPHVFGDISVKDSQEVNVNWNLIKAAEKKENGEKPSSQLDGVPIGLPALMKAAKIQKKAADVGFDWPDYSGALKKTEEELEELKEAIAQKGIREIEEELGDLIFSIVNVARFFKIESELALNKTISKFCSRFEFIEERVRKQGKTLNDLTLQDLDILWEESKV